ncbi:MAG: heme-binding domain-containing protein [Bacteriovoracia bacterium]
MKFALLVVVLCGPTLVFAHGGKDHSKHSMHIEKEQDSAELKRAREGYLKHIKPIFQKKCMDCHSSNTRYPWYHKLPGVKQMMEADIREAKEHMDMTGDFPFKGHGTPESDLKAIAEALENDSMPPFRYRLMHWDSKLTEEEKKIILEWVKG